MKKLLIPIIAALLLCTSCKKEYFETNVTNINGDLVYVEYEEIAPGDWIEDNTYYEESHTTNFLYHDYYNEYIDNVLIEKGFCLVYAILEECDVPLTHHYTYYDNAGQPHEALIRYDVFKNTNSDEAGSIRIYVECPDGTYDLFRAKCGIIGFKYCMMIINENI